MVRHCLMNRVNGLGPLARCRRIRVPVGSSLMSSSGWRSADCITDAGAIPALPIRSRQNWLKPHLRSMRCDLTDEEDAAFARLLSDTINDHRYLPLARIRLLKRILGRIRPERSPAPLPPIRHREIHKPTETVWHHVGYGKISAGCLERSGSCCA